MTPRPALSFAFLLAACPALAAGVPWGVADNPDNWGPLAFEDMNGMKQALSYYKPAAAGAKMGDDIPLYTLTAVAAQKGHDTYQARLSAFRASGCGPVFPTLCVVLPGTQFSWSPPPTAVYDFNKVFKHEPVSTYVAPRYKVDSIYTPAPKIIVLVPVEARETAPATFFPENTEAFDSAKYSFPVLAEPKADEATAMRVHRRFVAFEMLGIPNKALEAPLDTVSYAEMSAGTGFTAAESGDVGSLDAWVKGRRERIIAKAKEQRLGFEGGAAARPEKFNAFEGDLLWTLIGMSGKGPAFRGEIQGALVAADKRAAFVTKYRNLLRAEMTRYIDGAQPLVAGKGSSGPVTPAAYNSHWTGIKTRVAATVDGNADQLASNADPSAKPIKAKPTTVVSKPATTVKPKDDGTRKVDDMFGK